jgi:hypothetical protein
VTKVVQKFISRESEGQVLIQMSLEDALHYTPEQRSALIASYPAYIREARAYGRPSKGSGVVYPVTDESLGYWTDPNDRRFKKDLAIAMSKGIDKGFCWWLDEGRRNLIADKFQFGLYAFLMANLFNFRSGANREDEAMSEIKKLKEQLGIED